MRTLFIMLALLVSTSGWSQQTTVFTEANEAFKDAESLMQLGVYGKAQQEYLRTINLLRPTNEPSYDLIKMKAELGHARAAVFLDQPDGEKLILDFIRRYDPHPIARAAIIELADYYFNAKEYEKALDFYQRAPTGGMSEARRSEVKFRMGYANFVKKKFPQAKSHFRQIKDIRNDYYYPTNYYLGLTYFFEGDYPKAIEGFRVAERAKKYKDHIPFYLTQIYFAEGRYQELINYAEPKIKNRDYTSLKKQKEINQLVGQAYFELGNYQAALPYLEYYADRSGRLRPEEWYQLGVAEQAVGNYSKAITAFRELSSFNDQMGQYAMYYLGNSYLRNGQKQDARTAYASASRMQFDPVIQEEALFNYAKLSYELNDPQQAINALQKIPLNSRYYGQSQDLMADILVGYRDYERGLAILDGIPNKSPKLKETYQKVSYLRALQLLQQGKTAQAKELFNRSLSFAPDIRTKALATYWLADIAHREEEYEKSINLANEFLTLARTVSNLPDESSLFTANYLQGYNYLKLENYAGAQGFFTETVDGIQRNSAFIRNQDLKNNILGDATMRAGDCLFKRNRYAEAGRYYDEAINRRYSGYEYAMYQKANIEGLLGRDTDKVIALEQLVNQFPNSDYADDALLELSYTYQSMNQLNKATPPLQRLISDYRGKSDLINQALLQLGLISYNQGSTQQAISYYKQVFSNNPEPAEANLALSALEEIYVDDLGQPDQFFAFLETIPGYKPDAMAKDSISFRAAENQFENANYPRAITGYTDYLRKFPNGRYIVPAHYRRGESYAVQQQYSDALRDYDWVVQRGPSRYYTKALEKAAIIAYNHEQDFNKSYDLYTRMEAAAENDNQRFEAQLGALRSAYRSNNTQAVYEQANKVANNPAASQAQRASAHFYLGKIAYDRRDFPAAIQAFDQNIALSDNEQTAEARYLRADIYYQQRDLNTAQDLLLEANKESSGYPFWVAKSIILLSDVLAEKGDLYNARAALDALLANYDEDPELIRIAEEKRQRLNAQINAGSRLAPQSDPGTLELDDSGNR